MNVDKEMIERLREVYEPLDMISIETYNRMRELVAMLPYETLKVVADSKIKFVSHVARNRLMQIN